MSTWRRLWPALALGAALGPGAAFADPAAKPGDPQPDAEFLEFLGSVDSTADAAAPDDGSWIDYLAQADIDKAAKKAETPGPAGGKTGPDAKTGASKVKSDGQ